MTSNNFDRVFLRYDDDEEVQSSIRVKVNRLADGDWSYEVPGEFRHVCTSRECPDIDRLAMLILTSPLRHPVSA